MQPDQSTPDDSLQAAIELLHLELAELRRIVTSQGDAADQTAEVLGRTLSHLSDEVARLTERLDLLVSEEPRTT